MADDTRSLVQGNGLCKPVDETIEKWSLHPEIQYHIMPMPSPTSSPTTPKPQSNATGGPAKPINKDSEGNNFQGEGTGKSKGKISIPDNCEIKFGEQQKPICRKYSIGTCRDYVKPGKRCRYGCHVWGKSKVKKNKKPLHFNLKPDSSADSLNVHTKINLFCGDFLWIRAPLGSHAKEGFFGFIDHEFNTHKTATSTMSLNLQDQKSQALVSLAGHAAAQGINLSQHD